MKNPRKTKTVCITLPIDVIPRIKRMALEGGRSVSGYLSWLVVQEEKRIQLKGRISDIIQ